MRHVHSFERHELDPFAPRAGYVSEHSWNSQPWPDSIRAYICRCGEPGFEVPLDERRVGDDD